MGTLSLTDPVNGTVADATLIATNNAAIKAVVNGGIDNSNIASGAAIDASKISGLPGAIAPATSLPSGPSDGDQTILVDSTSAPTYAWLLQYLSAASAWIFIGGSPVVASDNTNTARSVSTNGSYQDFTGQPSFTIPATGTYIIQASSQIAGDSGGVTAHLSYKVGSTASSDNDSSLGSFSNSSFGTAKTPAVAVSCTASDVIKVQVKATTSHTITLTNTSLSITPVKI